MTQATENTRTIELTDSELHAILTTLCIVGLAEGGKAPNPATLEILEQTVSLRKNIALKIGRLMHPEALKAAGL